MFPKPTIPFYLDANPQGSGKKRFLLLQPTDRTRSPDEKTQDKVRRRYGKGWGNSAYDARGHGQGPVTQYYPHI